MKPKGQWWQIALRTSARGARPGGKTPIGVLPQEDAAKLMNVGLRSVTRATTIREKGIPELQTAVESGKAALWSASEPHNGSSG